MTRIIALAAAAFGLGTPGAGTPAPARAPSPEATPELVRRFEHPPAGTRIIKIIHSWPEAAADQDRLIGTLTNQGFGGVVCNVAFKDYLESETAWSAFKRGVGAARNAGQVLWLYDERGYPSGNAGGLVLRDHPEWEARGLLAADTESDGGPVELALPPGRPLLTAAFPLTNGLIRMNGKVDLAERVSGGRVRWEAPAGSWKVLAVTEDRLYDGTHAEMNLWAKIPYVNLLMREPTARFLEVTHERYAQQVGKDLGRHFVATFTDEPSLMSLFLKPMPYRPLPWAPDLAAEFRKRRGYALEPVLPALIEEAGEDGRRWRHDYWQTVGELVSENFFGQIQEWCRRHDLPSGGHLLMEEGFVAHVPLYGDFFKCLRRLDAPSIDCLTSVPAEVPWYIARLAASAAELEGKEIVMSETSDHAQRYRPPEDKRPVRAVTEAEIRGTCNRQMVSGVNAITSYYSFAGLSEAELRRINEWVGRCCLLLRGGHQVAPIAVLYPAESLAVHFRPARHWANEAPEASQIENACRAAADSLFQARRDFTFVDSRALGEATAGEGWLVHKQHRWRVVVLPAADTLPMGAWENLGRFVRGGGVLIALSRLPTNSETEFPSDRVRRLAKELFGDATEEPSTRANRAGGGGVFLPAGSEGLLPIVIQGVLEPDVSVSGKRTPIRATHRQVAGHEVYFLINDSGRAWQGEAGLCGDGVGEWWDPATGRRTPVEGLGVVKMNLEPYGAALYRFKTSRSPRRHASKDGALPNLVLGPLPVVEPILVKGEHVRGDLLPGTPEASSGGRSWTAAASLTKGQVDTFCFLTFKYSTELDLSAAECVAIDTRVPARQNASAQLLMILKEKDGGDFLATTGRSLAVAGHRRSFIPLDRFQLAGWSKDGDGLLDLARVSEVRVGWGGYLGREGEEVRFTLATPSAASHDHAKPKP